MYTLISECVTIFAAHIKHTLLLLLAFKNRTEN